MNSIVWLNGKIVPANEAKVSVFAHALHYATSAFEGIRAYEEWDEHNQPSGRWNIWLLKEHVGRLLRSAATYGMALPYSADDIERAIIDVVSRNTGHSYIRPLVFRNVDPKTGMGLGVNPDPAEVSVAIMTAPWRDRYVGEHLYNDGATVFVTDLVRAPSQFFPGLVKGSAGYAVWGVRAKAQANANHCSEALLQGIDQAGVLHPVDGSGMNLFAVHQSRVYTPDSEKYNVLPGLTQDFLLNHLRRGHCFHWEHRDLTLAELLDAHEVFMTGTATEVTPVTLIRYRDAWGDWRDREIGRGQKVGHPGRLTTDIANILRKAVHGRLPEYWQLLTPAPSLVSEAV